MGLCSVRASPFPHSISIHPPHSRIILLAGTNVFPESDAPYYRTGTWISAAFCLLIVVTSICLSFWLIHENKKLAAEGVPEVEEMEDTSTADVDGRQLRHRYIW